MIERYARPDKLENFSWSQCNKIGLNNVLTIGIKNTNCVHFIEQQNNFSSQTATTTTTTAAAVKDDNNNNNIINRFGYKKGRRVKMQLETTNKKLKWYGGEVIDLKEFQDKTMVDINFDDGTIEKDVLISDKDLVLEYNEGDFIQILMQEEEEEGVFVKNWWSGRVIKTHDFAIDIIFDDGEIQTNISCNDSDLKFVETFDYSQNIICSFHSNNTKKETKTCSAISLDNNVMVWGMSNGNVLVYELKKNNYCMSNTHNKKTADVILPSYTLTFKDSLLKHPIVDISISSRKGNHYIAFSNKIGITVVLGA